jgi:hypothetical protein
LTTPFGVRSEQPQIIPAQVHDFGSSRAIGVSAVAAGGTGVAGAACFAGTGFGSSADALQVSCSETTTAKAKTRIARRFNRSSLMAAPGRLQFELRIKFFAI